jgi:flagellar biosynthesis protein FlhA
MAAMNAESRSISPRSRRSCCLRRCCASLNVASTRVVLVYGHTGGAAAGHVIEASGNS